MIMELLNEKVERIIAPFLKEMGLELIELNVRRHRNETTVQILADKPFGGITLAQCTELNRRVGDAFEQENVFADHYVIEVSSPGLDRPLRTIKDFVRVTGREVRFFLSEPIENKIEHAGIVRKVEADSVTVDLDSAQVTIPITKINKAVQII